MANRNDVARLAGVSGATVTRVLNGSGFVSEETRKKVIEAAQALNYHPNYSAQVLRGKHTRQILVYFPQLFNPFYVHVYCGMDDYARKYEYGIMLTRYFDKDLLQQKRFDGVIVAVFDYDEYPGQLEFARKIGIPIAAANFFQEHVDMPFVRPDFEQAARLAAKHLIDLGHRQILYLDDTDFGGSKWDGIQACMRDEGVQVQRPGLSPPPSMYENLYELGHIYAERIHRMPSPPTGVIAANDAVATGLIGGLFQLGFRVPENISVVSFDDTMYSRFIAPPLTTVHLPKYEMGYETMRLMHNLIDGKPVANQVISARLIVRQSSRSVILGG